MSEHARQQLTRRAFLTNASSLPLLGLAGCAATDKWKPPSTASTLDTSSLCGVNYQSATTQRRDAIQAILSPNQRILSPLRYPDGSQVPFGQFVPATVEQELTLLRQTGFTNIAFHVPFVAWILNPVDFLHNLKFIIDTLDRLGMTATFKLWTTGVVSSLGSSPFKTLDIARATRGEGQLATAIQWISDRWDRDMRKRFAPSPGTHFHSFAWAEPDLALRFRLGGPTSWNDVVTFTQEFGCSISELIDRYIDALAGVFTSAAGRRVLLSYDLYNEADLGLDVPGDDLEIGTEGMCDFIAYCHARLRRAHGLQQPRYTVGVAWQMHNTDTVRSIYRRVAEKGTPLDYFSFHMYADDHPGLWTRPPFEERVDQALLLRDELANGAQLDLACSEFYAPYLFKGSRGQLGHILDLLRSAGIGAQIWSVLETNRFQIRGGRPTAPEGLYRPYDYAAGVNSTEEVLRIEYQHGPGIDEDFDSLLAWTACDHERARRGTTRALHPR